MQIEILEEILIPRGIVYKIKVEGKDLEILFLLHAVERIKQWGLDVKMVLETLILPDEVLIGHRNRFIAHKIYGEHLVRAIYEYQEEGPTLITVYFPYKERYYQGGKVYEDRIFKIC